MATQLAPRHETPVISDALLDKITRTLGATAEAVDRAAVFPRDNFEFLAGEGLIGLTVSRALGGQAVGLADALRVLGAVAKGEPSTALILFMTSPCSTAIWRKLRIGEAAAKIGGISLIPPKSSDPPFSASTTS